MMFHGFWAPKVANPTPSIEFASQIHPRIGDDGLCTEKTIPETKPASFCLRKSMGWESFWGLSFLGYFGLFFRGANLRVGFRECRCEVGQETPVD